LEGTYQSKGRIKRTADAFPAEENRGIGYNFRSDWYFTRREYIR